MALAAVLQEPQCAARPYEWISPSEQMGWIISQPALACRQFEAFGYPIEKLVSLLKPKEAETEGLPGPRSPVGANNS